LQELLHRLFAFEDFHHVSLLNPVEDSIGWITVWISNFHQHLKHQLVLQWLADLHYVKVLIDFCVFIINA
jgi:hypothetical protein